MKLQALALTHAVGVPYRLHPGNGWLPDVKEMEALVRKGKTKVP